MNDRVKWVDIDHLSPLAGETTGWS
ncbi:MAG: hypothetical protein RLZ94_2350, partial [Actinomycetota bacterium]